MISDGARRFRLPEAPEVLAEELLAGAAVVWEESVAIPTYDAGEPQIFPIYSDRRVYQGSSGRVYPLPFIESVERTKRTRDWHAVHLENRYLRLMILPELGGRIHVGYDKRNEYDFFYRNNVIKPALVGLAGPWIAGGVEFNWPQHHRPATYLPTEVFIERDEDGAVTVWCSDHDPFARMRGTHGVRIRPESSLIELRVRLHNRTADTQTFLWWANAAVRTHDDYQSFFPTDVHFVADHARRAVTAFPRADRTYYGIDYPRRSTPSDPDGDRLDLVRNIPVPTSYMVLDTEDDFFGGYDHRADAGFVHWADRRIAPGKKQWTWGNSAFGHAWERQLTDDDGPYVELMAGVFTDNQPDFSFLAPGELRTFSQFWYPIADIGVPVQATRDAAVAFRSSGGSTRLGLVVTRDIPDARIMVESDSLGAVVDERRALSPSAPWVVDLPGVDPAAVRVRVESGRSVLIEWSAPTDPSAVAEPATATVPPDPAEITSSDELVLTGLHLEQYRHPTRPADPYWLETVRRDAGDARANLLLGRQAFRRGQYVQAEQYLRASIARATLRNRNPPDGEAHYRLGLVLERSQRPEAAADAFVKAAWDGRWAGPAALALARNKARRGLPDAALDRLPWTPDAPDVSAARVLLLRKVGADAEAAAELREARSRDPLDALLREIDAPGSISEARMLLDVASDLDGLALADAALACCEQAAAAPAADGGNVAPIAHYRAALIHERQGRRAEADEARGRASGCDLTRCFPVGLDDLDALNAALAADPSDAAALDLLGIWLYDAGRREEALTAWRAAVRAGGRRAVLMRDLGLALANVGHDLDAAACAYDEALRSAPQEGRLWLERDLLAARAGEAVAARLERLLSAGRIVDSRDDLVVTMAELLCRSGRAEEARTLLQGAELRAWEGGEGRALAAWEDACLRLSDEALARREAREALAFADDALRVPGTLGEARHPLASTARIHLARFAALRDIGLETEAREALTQAMADVADPLAASDRAADAGTYWVGRAAAAAGDDRRAEAAWTALDARVVALRDRPEAIDYFATSLPDLLLFDDSTAAASLALADQLETMARAGRRASTRETQLVVE